MRVTAMLDDEWLAKAREATSIEKTSALINLALRRLIETEASRRLAALGGSEPDLVVPRRRRGEGLEAP